MKIVQPQYSYNKRVGTESRSYIYQYKKKMKTNYGKLLKAYEETLEDFKISLRNTPWYRFKYRRELSNEIERYEQLCLMTWVLKMTDCDENK